MYATIVAFYRNPGSGEGCKYVIAKSALDADNPLKLELPDQLLPTGGDASRKGGPGDAQATGFLRAVTMHALTIG